MKTSRTISDKIGPTRIDHSAYLVRTGKLSVARAFFVEQLHWINDGSPVVDDWGTAVFVRPPHTTNRTQLTEYLCRPPDLAVCTDGEHLAISVMMVSAEEAVKAIHEWVITNGLDQGFSCVKANADGTKWFVFVPELFTFALEIVA